MSHVTLILTISATDKPGVVQKISDVALANKASWQESSLAHLCGKFVGIIKLHIASEQEVNLVQALKSLSSQGIHIEVHANDESDSTLPRETVELYLEANDRPGIVEEVTSALSKAEVNIEQLETWRESASMAGYDLFLAELAVSMPANMKTEDIESCLESISDDLIVTVGTVEEI